MRFAILTSLVVGLVLCDDPIVNTPKGPVLGRSEGNYSTFLGIPYAKVDEDNPFGVSTPYPHFEETFEAVDGTIKCPQFAQTAQGILQCLRLNIYVPKRQNEEKLPVFVWFHGGGYFFGSAGEYDGRYLVQKDIIVVTANYRLGPYGFLCLNDPEVPGNQGLKDQIDALKWVRDNIEAFGGDPSKVTIAGESYGGGSVDLHLYSKFDKYFDKAIVQSGGIKVRGMFVKPDYDAAIKLAKLFNHTTRCTKDALNFLAKVDPLELVTKFDSAKMLLRVCKEKKFKHVENFVTEDNFHLYKSKKIKDTPIIFGYNSKESFGDVAGGYFEEDKDIFYTLLNETFRMKEKELRKLADIAKKFYIGSAEVSKENMLPLVDFSSDFILNYAAENSVSNLVEQGAKVYKYVFSYIGNSPFKNVTGVGAMHTEELQYLFLFMGKELTKPEDIMMREKLTTLWANFVKYGNPTPESTSLLPVAWTPVSQASKPYLDIDTELTMKADVYHHRIAFWDLLWHHNWKSSRILKC